MSPPVPRPPLTRPSMKYFQPYRQTVIGFVVVAFCVVLLILAVRWLMGGGAS